MPGRQRLTGARLEQRPLVRLAARVDEHGRSRAGGNGIERRLDREVADAHSRPGRRARRRWQLHRKVTRVAGRVGDVKADQVGAGRRRLLVDLPVPDRLLSLPRRQEALDRPALPPPREVRSVDLDCPATVLVSGVGDRRRQARPVGDQVRRDVLDHGGWRRALDRDRQRPGRARDRHGPPLVDQRDPDVVDAVGGDPAIVLAPVPDEQAPGPRGSAPLHVHSGRERPHDVAALIDDVHVDVVGAVLQVERDLHPSVIDSAAHDAVDRVDHLRRRPRKARDQRRRDLQVLGDEERGDGRGDERPERDHRQPLQNRSSATLGILYSWNAARPRGFERHSIARIEPP